ncbi:MAG: fibrobacter succinogenes major paralogous domain-containing protein [Bacteroidales bacterium]
MKRSNGEIRSVKIGEQVWMAQNLDVTSFRNGDSIPEAKTAEEWTRFGTEGKPAYCVFSNDQGNQRKYGLLYNWYAVNDPRGLAPGGWHIPTDYEWTRLTVTLGGDMAAALRMRSGDIAMTGKKNSNAGFSGLPGGARGSNGGFYGLGSHACWWSSSPVSESNAWVRVLDYVKVEITTLSFHKYSGVSVRCVKD